MAGNAAVRHVSVSPGNRRAGLDQQDDSFEVTVKIRTVFSNRPPSLEWFGGRFQQYNGCMVLDVEPYGLGQPM
jgi:hypothetical protein